MKLKQVDGEGQLIAFGDVARSLLKMDNEEVQELLMAGKFGGTLHDISCSLYCILYIFDLDKLYFFPIVRIGRENALELNPNISGESQ